MWGNETGCLLMKIDCFMSLELSTWSLVWKYINFRLKPPSRKQFQFNQQNFFHKNQHPKQLIHSNSLVVQPWSIILFRKKWYSCNLKQFKQRKKGLTNQKSISPLKKNTEPKGDYLRVFLLFKFFEHWSSHKRKTNEFLVWSFWPLN